MQPQLIIKNPIKTEADYENALVRVDTLLNTNVKKGTSDGDELECLIVLIEAYEKQYYALPPPPIEAVNFKREPVSASKALTF